MGWNMRTGIRSYKDKADHVQHLVDTFPYRIDLPNPTSQFEDSNWVIKRDSAHAERFIWIRDNIGSHDSGLWDWVDIKCLMSDGRHGVTYFFIHQHHALLFKLSCGGSQ